ncbi:MAG: biotin-dependent carboxyltransferase family protein [Flavobacteriaceae bacterium]|nr:biotin-dependent carboxyltransferase family protein [Flavobacteriaceae bacterium]
MIRVIKPGFYTTVQDLGRSGYRKYGVPISGAMDQRSMIHGNLLLNNHENEAVIEATLVGPTLEFTEDTIVCITGADMNARIAQKSTAMYQPIKIKSGERLTFGSATQGTRTYLSIQCGMDIEEVLSSKSYYPNIAPNSKLEKDQEIHLKTNANLLSQTYSKISRPDFSETTLTLYKGPEYDLLSEHQKNRFETEHFTVALNNRMAYRFQEKIENNLFSIITSAVLPGTIQLTASGDIIILMRDSQTTGGYPRIFQLTNEALNLLSQKRTGDLIYFQIINQ